eukprot:CAMPEP_0167794846 /NCGR_PEP_ID=MMETSP0111_2-20121227/14051_1 /TAXON_ID=91324 /ORGANISM="Lotharella globosa, Strain CCCM811" /LENGTH=48 /DNA_ID= /DNA_START= /DNA_END= /DNA_ORIENTATION=
MAEVHDRRIKSREKLVLIPDRHVRGELPAAPNLSQCAFEPMGLGIAHG